MIELEAVFVLYNLVISITTVLQIHIQIQSNTQHKCMYSCRRVLLFRYERFINFLTSVLRHEDRDTILAMLSILSDATNVRRILWCFGSLSVEIRKSQLHLSTANPNSQLSSLYPNNKELNYRRSWSYLNFSTAVFLKSSNSLLISSGHDVIHAPTHFLSGVYYDNGDCHILCARA